MDRSYPYSRRLVSRARLRKRLAAVAAAGLAGAAGLFMLGWQADPLSALSPSLPSAAIASTTLPAMGDFPASAEPGRALRRIYPYSVVPGGVSGQAELARVIRTDRVVAAHYASFDVSKARPVVVDKPRAVYVSYRKGDQVYWTTRKLMLAEGETLLSDGRNEMRARCANRISDVPQYPVEAHPPDMEELDNPVEVADGEPLRLDALPVSMPAWVDMPGYAGVQYPVHARAPDNMPTARIPASSPPGIADPGPATTRTLSAFPISVGSLPKPVDTHVPPPDSDDASDSPQAPQLPSDKPGGTVPAPDSPSDLPVAPPPPAIGTPVPPSGDPPGVPPLSLPPGGDRPPLPPSVIETKPHLPEPQLVPAPPRNSTETSTPPAEVPEPASIWLFGALFPAVFALRRRTRS